MPGFEILGKEEKQAVMDVMDRGVLFRYEFGDQRDGVYRVAEFEEAFAKYTGAGHALAVSSGSAAVKVGLAALGVGGGDEVIVPGFTFVATWEAVLDLGAAPVFAEIDETLCLDPKKLAEKVTEKTAAIVVVHMMGSQADMPAIMAVAEEKGLPVFEDTAQAAGAFLNGKHLGTFGAAGSFSFDSVKTLTTGEGGMVISDSEEIWRNASEYHDHGHDHKPVGRGNEGRRFIGFNYRMMELQGALGLAQLKKLPKMVATQQANKAALKEALARIKGLAFRRVLDEKGDSATFLSWFMPTASEATKLARLLGENGAAPIQWGKNTWHAHAHWEHLHGNKTVATGGWPFDRGDQTLAFGPEDLPATNELLERCLSWQIMLGWDESKLQSMTAAINRAASAL